MENSRWFLLVTFCIVGLTQGSVNADILFSGATGGFNSEGNLVDASTGAPLHSPFFNLYSGPGILPQTGLYVGNTSVTGTVSGVTSFNSVPDAATVSATMQYSLTGGPTLPNEGATMSGGAGFDYRITGDGPSESQFYYISGQGEIKGYLAAGDTLSYSASAILGNGSFYSQGASGTLTDPGAFDIPVIAPRTLFAYQHGAEIVDYSGGFTTISMSLTATFTKGTSGGSSYINFDPGTTVLATTSAVPEPGTMILATTGAVALIAYGACRRGSTGNREAGTQKRGGSESSPRAVPTCF